jgi:hypothetical protein
MHKEQTIMKQQSAAEGRIKVANAKYLDGYKLLIAFTDHKQQVVDFSDFINSRAKGFLSKYKSQDEFRKFNIERGNVVWGKNWDLIFPVYQLYNGYIE